MPRIRQAYNRLPPGKGADFFARRGKQVYVDRVEWQVIPGDPATASAALQSGEGRLGGMACALIDLIPMLKKSPGVKDRVIKRSARPARHDPLQPALPAVRQSQAAPGLISPRSTKREFMDAVAGEQSDLVKTGASGYFTSSGHADGELCRNGGVDQPAQYRKGETVGRRKQRLQDGEKIVLMSPTDHGASITVGLPGRGQHVFKKIGPEHGLSGGGLGHVGDAACQQGAAGQGRLERVLHLLDRPDGGFNPGGHWYPLLRGNMAPCAWFGWPTDPKLEELRAAWFDVPPTLPRRRRSAEQIQLTCSRTCRSSRSDNGSSRPATVRPSPTSSSVQTSCSGT